MPAPTKIKRKRYVIAARFQLRYIIYILLFLYLGAAIAGYTVYYSTWTILGEKLASVYPRGRLIYIFRQANITLLIRLLLISPIFVFIGIILSHRIAGPIYRIGKYIESLMQGDYARGLTLRKKDEFKILAHKMTQLCYKLREDEEARKKMGDEILYLLKQNNTDPQVLAKIKLILEDIESAHVHEHDQS
jgi:methyl-accepting chemotaxis protein